MGLRSDDRVLYVGAGAGDALERYNDRNPIVAVDLKPRPSRWLRQPNVTVQVADGTRLPFPDGSFDVAFSNSVIEHVDDLPAFARELRRVARSYYVQTPNRWFPVEPHFRTLVLHWLPTPVRERLSAVVKVGDSGGRWRRITLLSAREMHLLFPDAELHRERVLGMTKSFMAVRRAPAAVPFQPAPQPGAPLAEALEAPGDADAQRSL